MQSPRDSRCSARMAKAAAVVRLVLTLREVFVALAAATFEALVGQLAVEVSEERLVLLWPAALAVVVLVEAAAQRPSPRRRLPVALVWVG